MIHFIRPFWLFALIPLAVILWQLIRHHGTNKSPWQKICDPELYQAIKVNTAKTQSKWPLIFLGLAWLITTLALAGPSFKKIDQPVYQSLNSTVIILDLSPDMLAQDLKPNRLERAKFKLLDLLNTNRGGQTGLIVFAGEPYVVSPLTQDAHTIANMVPVLSPNLMPTRGNNVAWALKLASQLLQQGGGTDGNIILITANAGNSQALAAARHLHASGIDLSILAIGTPEGAPIPLKQGGFMQTAQGNIDIAKVDLGKLQALATAGGGILTSLTNSNQDIKALLKQTQNHDIDNKTKAEHKTQTAHHQDQGRWLLIPILFLAALS